MKIHHLTDLESASPNMKKALGQVLDKPPLGVFITDRAGGLDKIQNHINIEEIDMSGNDKEVYNHGPYCIVAYYANGM